MTSTKRPYCTSCGKIIRTKPRYINKQKVCTHCYEDEMDEQWSIMSSYKTRPIRY